MICAEFPFGIKRKETPDTMADIFGKLALDASKSMIEDTQTIK